MSHIRRHEWPVRISGKATQMTPRRSLGISLVFPSFEDRRPQAAYYVAPPLGLLRPAAVRPDRGRARQGLENRRNAERRLPPADLSI